MTDTGSRGDFADVFFLPFTVPEADSVEAPVDIDVLSRRVPDLLHQLLNGGPEEAGPVGMLEIQSPPDEGPPRWMSMQDTPEVPDVLSMIEQDAKPRALVGGMLYLDETHLRIEITIHFATHTEQFEGTTSTRSVHGLIRYGEPARGLIRLAEHLASVLRVKFLRPSQLDLPRTASSFFHTLEALDSLAIFAADPGLEPERRGESLLRPFFAALNGDRGCGWLVEGFAAGVLQGVDDGRVEVEQAENLFDACLELEPIGLDACVAVAENLTAFGDERRAEAWLRHAAAGEDPSGRALECLGVVLANRGGSSEAKALWQRGAALDGSPEFFGHLSRLAFSEGRDEDGWDLMLRGLWRFAEKVDRRAEWVGAPWTPSVLLRYLSEMLEQMVCTDEVAEVLCSLRGQLTEAVERIDLGLCLARIGRSDDACDEIEEGLRLGVSPSAEDRGVRALLGLEIPGFERRFEQASDRAAHGGDPSSALAEMQSYLERRPEFWPALFYAGVAMQRLGHDDAGLDLMAEVLSRRPGQLDALVAMADMFASRGNAKRALECVEEALDQHEDDQELHLHRARLLEALGRESEAEGSLDRAIELENEG